MDLNVQLRGVPPPSAERSDHNRVGQSEVRGRTITKCIWDLFAYRGTVSLCAVFIMRDDEKSS